MQEYLSRWSRKNHQANSTPGIMDSERNIICQSTLICNWLSNNYKHAKCNKSYKNESSWITPIQEFGRDAEPELCLYKLPSTKGEYTERWGKISRLTGQFHGMEAIGLTTDNYLSHEKKQAATLQISLENNTVMMLKTAEISQLL